MSVTKLRRFLSGNKITTTEGVNEPDDPRQEEGSQSSQSVRRTLASQMAKSKRNGSWFRLSRMERGILSLSLRLKVTFESAQLAKALVSVLKRLADLRDAVYSQLIAGTRLAWSFADAAVSWGNLGARRWKNDRNYALFLGRFVAGVKGYR
jgi:hypothetical protein